MFEFVRPGISFAFGVSLAVLSTAFFQRADAEGGTELGRMEWTRASGETCVLLFDSSQISDKKLRNVVRVVYGDESELRLDGVSPERMPVDPASETWKGFERKILRRESLLKTLDLPPASESLRAKRIEEGQFELRRATALNLYLRNKEPLKNLKPLLDFSSAYKTDRACTGVLRAIGAKKTEAGFKLYWKAQIQECLLKDRKPLAKCEAQVRSAGITLEKLLDPRFLAEQGWWQCVNAGRPSISADQRERVLGALIFSEECGSGRSDEQPEPEISDGPGQSMHN